MEVWVLCEKVLPFILPMSCLLHMVRPLDSSLVAHTDPHADQLTNRLTIKLPPKHSTMCKPSPPFSTYTNTINTTQMRKRLSGTEQQSLRLAFRRTLFLTDVGSPGGHHPSDDYDATDRFSDSTGYHPAPP